jgi:hypothetical protein
MRSNFTGETRWHQRSEMPAGEEPEALDDGLSADEKTQLRELCVLIVISEFLETAGNQPSIADSQGNQE